VVNSSGRIGALPSVGPPGTVTARNNRGCGAAVRERRRPGRGSANMPVEKWSDTVAVVRLSDDPAFSEDLDALEQMMETNEVDVVLDFSGVHYINSSNIAKLLKLRKAIVTNELRLVLCGVNTQIWGAFLVTGLDKIFQFADNVTMGLTMVQIA
jgi:anti-anti-sigma factor